MKWENQQQLGVCVSVTWYLHSEKAERWNRGLGLGGQ